MSVRPGRPARLTARSAILSALLGVHPAQASSRGIIEVAVHLGFGESAVRVALTRLVAAGDLERHNGIHRLSPRLIARQQRQDEALSPSLRPWDGRWRLVVIAVPADAAGVRIATRNELSEVRYAELREGVWLRPDNLDHALSDALQSRSASFTAEPDEDIPVLTARLFDPSGWAAAGENLLIAYRDADSMSARFEIAAAMVRHILHDPLLPDELLPADWPGDRLRETYGDFRTSFGTLAAELLDVERVD